MLLPPEELKWICNHSILNPSPEQKNIAHFNWKRILISAINNGVAPLIYHSLKKSGNKTSIPVEVYTRFKQEYEKSAANNVHYEITLSKMVTELRAKGTEIILLRGLSIAHSHYPNPALRQIRDLDLFIRPRDFQHIHHLMRLWDFKIKYPEEGKMPFIRGRKRFCQQASNREIQFHWEQINDARLRSAVGSGFKAYQLWDRLEHIDIQGVSINILPLDHLFLYQCVHLAFNRRLQRLLSLCDLHMMLSGPHSSEIHERILPKLALNPGTSAAVHYCLKMLRSLFGISGIDEAINKSEPHRFFVRALCNILRPSDTVNFGSRSAQLRRRLFREGIKIHDKKKGKRNLRVLLVSFNIRRNYNLAVEYLRLHALETARLEEHVDIRIINADRNVDRFFGVLRIMLARPQVIGFSCYVWNIQKTLAIAKLVKKVLPKAQIVFGGQEVTFSDIDFLTRYPFIDVVIEGEGEETFSDLLTHMVNDRNGSLAHIPGLAFRTNGTVQKTDKRPLIKNLDIIGSPYLSGRIPSGGKYRLGMMLELCRGCRYRCTFCFEGKKYGNVRSFPIDRIEQEVNLLFAHGKRRFHVMDPIIGNHDSVTTLALQRIFQRIQDIDHCDVSVEVFAELLNEKSMNYLKAFTIFDVGLQTIHPPVLRNIRRGFHRQRFIKGVRLLKQLDRQVNIYLIMGLPEETLFTYLEAIRFAASLDPSYLFLNQLCVLNGTELRDRAEEFGLNYDPLPPYHIIETPDMSQDEIRRLRVFSDTLTAEHNIKINR